MFEKHGVLNKRELWARYEVLLEYYTNKTEIESFVIQDLANTHIIPGAYKYVNELIHTAKNLKDLGLAAHNYTIESQVKEICTLLDTIKEKLSRLKKELQRANKHKEAKQKAIAFADKVKPIFHDIRTMTDGLEEIVDDSQWRLPKYRELLYLR